MTLPSNPAPQPEDQPDDAQRQQRVEAVLRLIRSVGQVSEQVLNRGRLPAREPIAFRLVREAGVMAGFALDELHPAEALAAVFVEVGAPLEAALEKTAWDLSYLAAYCGVTLEATERGEDK